MRVVVVAALLVGGCAYQPGSFRSAATPFAGARASIACVDLAVDRRADLPSGDAVVAYEFGNRCSQPALVDLASADVVARTPQGAAVVLEAFDPTHELAALWLDGGASGREVIAYPAHARVREVCVDAGSIVRAPAHAWLCLPEAP